MCQLLGEKSRSRTKFVTRDYSKFSKAKFVNDLAQLNWELIIDNDINKSFSTSYNKLNRMVNKHAPLKRMSIRKAKQLSKPWILKGLRIPIRKKNEFFYSGDKGNCKLYRNKISTLSRLSKKLYYHYYFEMNTNNIKKTWEGINSSINWRKRKVEM